jgi:hypothetical protein
LETCSVSPSADMLPFGVTIAATVPQRSDIPEGLKNYPVTRHSCKVSVILSDLSETRTFWTDFGEVLKYEIS